MFLLEVKNMYKDLGCLLISHMSGRPTSAPKPYRLLSVYAILPEQDHNTLLLKVEHSSVAEY